MRVIHDALLSSNEELFTLSTGVDPTSINLDPNTRGRIIIRLSAKSYVLRQKAAASDRQPHKLACFTSVTSDTLSLPVTPTPTTPEPARGPRRAPLSLSHSDAHPASSTTPSSMARSGGRAMGSAAAQRKPIFEGRIEKRKTSSKFRPMIKPSLQPSTPPELQSVTPPASPASVESRSQSSCNCDASSSIVCSSCRVLKLTQSFSSIIAIQCDRWRASSKAST